MIETIFMKKLLVCNSDKGGGTGGPGGPGGHAPTPKSFDHWPQNSGPVVKIFAKLLLSTLRNANFQTFSPAAG